MLPDCLECLQGTLRLCEALERIQRVWFSLCAIGLKKIKESRLTERVERKRIQQPLCAAISASPHLLRSASTHWSLVAQGYALGGFL